MDRSRLVTALLVVALVVACGPAVHTHSPAHGEDKAGTAASHMAARRLAKVLGLPTDVAMNTYHVHPPRVMLDLYNSVADDHGQSRRQMPYKSTVVRSFKEAEPTLDGVIRFNLPTYLINEELLQAELHVYVLHVPHSDSSQLRHVRVFQLTSSGSRNEVDSRIVSDGTRHHVLYVRSAVARWLAGEPSLNLLLMTETPGGDLANLTVSRRGHHHNRQPLLLLFGTDNSTAVHHQADSDAPSLEESSVTWPTLSRRRRSLNSTTTNNLNSNDLSNDINMSPGCRRLPLHIDLKKMEFSQFILSPTSYNAYHCLGECQFPFSAEDRPTNHAAVQSMARLLGLEHVQHPSCVPSSLSSLTTLYINRDSTITIKRFEMMVADECGCQ